MKQIIIFLLLLMAVSVYGSDVTRTILRDGNDLTVFLEVSIENNETFYSIDETYPCEIKDVSHHGDITEESHVKWLFFSKSSLEIVNVTYNYTLDCGLGKHNFSGIYMFEFDIEENIIQGNSSVALKKPAESPEIKNKVKGNISNITTNINLSMEIANISENLSEPTEIMFRQEDEVIVEFTFDFSRYNLSLENISLEKQDDEDFGFLIISNLDIKNSEKTIYLDNINGNRVCIIDKNHVTLSDFTENCSSEQEKSLICNGVESEGYTCTKQGSRFKVKGLKHSAVKEYIYETYDNDSSSGDDNQDDGSDDTGSSRKRSNTGGGSGGDIYISQTDDDYPDSADILSYFIPSIRSSYNKSIFSNKIPLNSVNIKVLDEVKNIDLEIIIFNENSYDTDENEYVLYFFKIKSNIDDSLVGGLDIHFYGHNTGEKHVLKANIEDKWINLNSEITRKDDDYKYYKAESARFTEFVLISEKEKNAFKDDFGEKKDRITGDVTEDVNSSKNNGYGHNNSVIDQNHYEIKNYNFIFVISALILGIVLAGILLYKKVNNSNTD
ncbi:MAG: hypothetical protein ACLFUO_03220 [Candidatus Woesearchaeota archaeon]